jgi:hypothetical protein
MPDWSRIRCRIVLRVGAGDEDILSAQVVVQLNDKEGSNGNNAMTSPPSPPGLLFDSTKRFHGGIF